MNALAYQACFRSRAGRDRSRPISRDAILAAREEFILRRDTHLHQLADKLREDGIRRVVKPLLGGSGEEPFSDRDSNTPATRG